jgi:hypothetical protein
LPPKIKKPSWTFSSVDGPLGLWNCIEKNTNFLVCNGMQIQSAYPNLQEKKKVWESQDKLKWIHNKS